MLLLFIFNLCISSCSQTIYSLFNHGESKNPFKESPQKGFIILCIISKFPHTQTKTHKLRWEKARILKNSKNASAKSNFRISLLSWPALYWPALLPAKAKIPD